jgi:hypothetical protein
MNDTLFEEQLRKAFERLPLPTSETTEAAMDGVGEPGGGFRGRGLDRIPRRARLLALAAVLPLLGIGTGFAMGRSLAPEAKVRTVRAAPLSATGGPGFLPATGWSTAQTGATEIPQAASAIAATGDVLDLPGQAPLHETVAHLGADGVAIQVVIYGRQGFRPALDRSYPARTLPLRLDDGVAQHEWEGGSGLRYVLTGRVEGWLVEADTYFGSDSPSAAVRAKAQQQLDRLILPNPCPVDAQVLAPSALDGAKDAVRALLFVGVDDTVSPPADYGDPQLTVARGAAAALVPPSCRGISQQRVATVEVSFPHLAGRPQLARQTYLASLQGDRWSVWARVR